MELQKKSGNQFVELDSDCKGRGQFSMQYPIKKERTKIRIAQKVSLVYGQIYRLSFDVKKRRDSVGENLLVKYGKRRKLYSNSDLTTSYQRMEILFKADKKVVDEYGDMLVQFKPTGGKSDSFGLFLDNIDLKIVNDCSLKRTNVCKSPYSVVYYNPLGYIAPERTNPAEALGEADAEPFVPSDVNFVSLGYGGSIIFKFKPAIKNVNGFDLRVYETTGGNNNFSQYPEEADVYGSNNMQNWSYLGKIKNDNCSPELGMVDLGVMKRAKYIKIVDSSNIEFISGKGDGFDVDALACMGQGYKEFKTKVYYVDKTKDALYTANVNNKRVRLKKIFDYKSQNGIHVALSNNGKYLYLIDNTTFELFIYDTRYKVLTKIMDTNLSKPTQIAISSTGRLYLGDMDTDKVYLVNFEYKTLDDLGHIYKNGKKVDLSGGDIAFTDKAMYVVTQSKGGVLYEVKKDSQGKLEVTNTVVSGVGKASGLAVLGDDRFLVSLLNEDFMWDILDGVPVSKTLKGDLLEQGTGADLASSIEEMPSEF